MLFRADSAIASEAVFGATRENEETSVKPVIAQVTPETLELERALTEIQTLRIQMKELEERWDEALANERNAARAEAALHHRDNDDRQYRALCDALDKARTAFDAGLGQELEGAAAALAAAALGRLVAVRQEEDDWLQRVIMERLSRLRAGAAVALHVPPGVAERFTAAGQGLPCDVIADPKVANGTAVLRLALGEIEIDPGDGTAKLLEALVGGTCA